MRCGACSGRLSGLLGSCLVWSQEGDSAYTSPWGAWEGRRGGAEDRNLGSPKCKRQAEEELGWGQNETTML